MTLVFCVGEEMSRPSTRMWSRSGSALAPSSVTTTPFTATLPAVMSCSALRREVTPAAAMIFCKRSMNSFQHKKLTTDFTDSTDWKKLAQKSA